MNNDPKTIRVLTSVISSEHYDCASHALIELNLSCLETIEEKLKEAQDSKRCRNEFSYLSFQDYGAEFFDLGLCDVETFEYITDEKDEYAVLTEIDDRLSCGETIYVPSGFSISQKSLASIRPMKLHVTSTDFYWCGWDKHVGMSGYVETASFSLVDLMQWKTKLLESGITYAQLLNYLSSMSSEELDHIVTIKDGTGEFCVKIVDKYGEAHQLAIGLLEVVEKGGVSFSAKNKIG